MSSPNDPNQYTNQSPDSHHSSAGQTIASPFRVIADFREAIDGWQFTHVPDREHPTRFWTASIQYRYLETADYVVPEMSLFIVRHQAEDLLALLQHWPDSFARQRSDLIDLQLAGASCLIVIEGNADAIAKALTASDLLGTWDDTGSNLLGCDIPWLLVEGPQTAEQIVFEIMHRSWQHAHDVDGKPAT
jgi:hypothetical protein